MSLFEESEIGEIKKSRKSKIPWSIIYIAATVIVIILFGVFTDEFDNLFVEMSKLIPWCILAALVVEILYFLFESLITKILMNSQDIKMSLGGAFKISLIGIYYADITPASTGGQPAQSAYLLRDNIPVGTSTAVLFIKFFTYQCAFFLCSFVSFFFMYDKISVTNPMILPVIILGLVVNGFSIIFFPSLFFKPVLNTICCFAKWIVNKISFLQKRFHLLESIDKFEIDFGGYSTNFKEKKKSVILCIFLSIIEFIFQMSILYFIFLAFGYGFSGYFDIFFMQCLLQVSVSFMPMPGGSGVQEIGFVSYFDYYFTGNNLYAALMIWRFFTFYLEVICGAILVVVDQIIYRRKKLRESGL